MEIIRQSRKKANSADDNLFEFELAQDFIPAEFVEEYLEMYSELTILAPSKYYAPLFDELTLRRRGELISAEDMSEDRQVSKLIFNLRNSKEFCIFGQILPHFGVKILKYG